MRAAIALVLIACSGPPREVVEPPVPTTPPVIPIDAAVAVNAPAVVDAPAAAKRSPPAAMAKVPATRFHMGAVDGRPDERPVHVVDVAAFSIDLTEVTVAAYAECLAARRCTIPAERVDACNWERADLGTYPVNCVNWGQAAAYCAFVGKRLPTEEEWELAARGTDGRIYPWGNGAFGGEECEIRSADLPLCPVASAPKGRSPYGLYDMTGNADEWTASTYCPYDRPGCAGSRRTTRGGASDFLGGTATSRDDLAPNTIGAALGFRCAQSEP
jgi:formylglycine-generating enzyme required for sulfatase activity